MQRSENIRQPEKPGRVPQADNSVPRGGLDEAPEASLQVRRPGRLQVIRRNSKVTAFDPAKIEIAMTKAFLAVEKGSAAASTRVHETVQQLSGRVVAALARRQPEGGTLHIEDIQDQVELALMRAGEHRVARAYVIYREDRARARRSERPGQAKARPVLHIRGQDKKCRPLDWEVLEERVREACKGVEHTDTKRVMEAFRSSLFDGMSEEELGMAQVIGARMLIEEDPQYSYVAARLLLGQLQREVFRRVEGARQAPPQGEMEERYPGYFRQYVRQGAQAGLLDPQLEHFDLERLGRALRPERDLQFTYLGLQTLYDRYLIHHEGVRLELPQAFFMRVAMGMALREVEREERAIEFYDLLSSFRFMSSTPTLFNSGTRRPQMSSCFLTTVPDDLDGIYSAIRDDALLSKYAGGLGNDWTNVRAMGAHIRGTNGKSQGVVPFLKVVNDTAVAVNQGGKRKGAICAYLEVWHLDIEEFLELRKNTGDDRRRTHDMNTACWIPDLFMQRVHENGDWALFSPEEVPDLHELSGLRFAERYREYEELAAAGGLRNYKTLPAVTLWRKMLSMLYETGHPWLTFKDSINVRSPQRHTGVVHSSNLCTEITLNTSPDEIAVCNLGSVNLSLHTDANGLDAASIEATVRTAMRMLDNVIDCNYYTVPQARRSNLRHRPVGLGIMGFQDALYKLRLPYASREAVEFADRSMELVSFHAIQASVELAEERGPYSSFAGSLWSQGVLPIDSISLLQTEREGDYLEMDTSQTLAWGNLRERVRESGIRNSNCMAIAPTATISNICGVSQSIEPTYQNLFVKSNLSGEFTIVNPFLVRDLKELDLWDEVMVHDLKYFDGSVQRVQRLPDELKKLYATAFEIDPAWLIEAASRRQKWIDQAQSLNLYIVEPDGPKLDKLYRNAWRAGMKTTYYLRSLAATHVEKSTMDKGQTNGLNAVCAVGDVAGESECEACQ